jgi:hypothetical protein
MYNPLYCSLESKETHTSKAQLWLLLVIYYTKPMMLISCFTQCGLYVFPSWLCLWPQTKIFHHLFKIFHNWKIPLARMLWRFSFIVASLFHISLYTNLGHLVVEVEPKRVNMFYSHIYKTIHAKHQFYLIIPIQMSTNLSNKLILK